MDWEATGVTGPGLLETARRRIVLGDGGMGTQLQQAGLEPGGCGDLWNLEHPDRVQAIQEGYRVAGAELLLTNTFGANRYVLDRYDAADRVTEVNRAAVAIARRAAESRPAAAAPDAPGDRRAGEDGRVAASAWVLGDIGPFGGFLEPLGEHAADDVLAAFREQAVALVTAGVDGIIIETMTAPHELTLAVRAAREAGARLVIASMAFDTTRVGLRTMMGTSPETAAEAMLAAGADVLGANCGTRLTMADFVEIIHTYRMVAPDTVVMVEPNAGQPELAGSEIVYREAPEAMAAGLPQLVEAGAAIIGGCCGTTREHIRALARRRAALR